MSVLAIDLDSAHGRTATVRDLICAHAHPSYRSQKTAHRLNTPKKKPPHRRLFYIYFQGTKEPPNQIA
ncbi:hypothetical protein PQQ52_21065 [Paraburkholderia sediminicola]|uniref:hypothetical protein n=1 Tax=Paraburkholderia sediminicola TaxID=458836 RepID=UPI0038BA9450